MRYIQAEFDRMIAQGYAQIEAAGRLSGGGARYWGLSAYSDEVDRLYRTKLTARTD